MAEIYNLKIIQQGVRGNKEYVHIRPGPWPECEAFVHYVDIASFIADYLVLSARIDSVQISLPCSGQE
jgi:hypothetical protein